MPSNLLFITTDHQRADSLGMVQCGMEVTPHLNRLATESARFTRAYTSCPLCAPARTALATGMYPTRTGVLYNDWQGQTARDCTPLHQRLSDVGYRLAHVGMHHIRLRPTLQERVPFQPFITNADHKDYLAALDLTPDSPDDRAAFKRDVLEKQGDQFKSARYSSADTAVWPLPAEHFLDMYFAREADQVLKQAQEPFALFVNLWAPHPPLRVPEPFYSKFDPEGLELPGNIDQPGTGEPSNRRAGVPARLAEGLSLADWRRAWAAHLGLVNLADECIGRLLETLEATGLREQTIVVFCSDHGEMLGQHGMYQKMEMYEPSLRVPLIIRDPRAEARLIETPVSHLDLVPTILEALGQHQPEGLDGRSLFPAISQGTLLEERPIYSQYSGNPCPGNCRRAVVLGHYKYVYDPHAEAELFDLEADPLEMENLAGKPEHGERLRTLHALARDWARQHGDFLTL